MIRYFDEPFGNSSAIPTYFCARLAAQNGVTSLLAGDGGDELFGGNERYAIDKILQFYQSVPRSLRKAVIEPALRVLPSSGPTGKLARYIRRSNIASPERYFSYNFLVAHPATDVFTGDFITALNDYSVLDIPTRYYQNAPARDHLDRLLYIDMKLTLADNDLPKVIQMTEMAGVRPRFPFLDRSVADMAGSIPARLKVKGLKKRYLFKKAFQKLLPPAIVGKTKHGFGIPVSTWLNTFRPLRELARDTLGSTRARQRGYFQSDFIDNMFRMYEGDNSTYYGDALWAVLVLELWHQQFVDAPLHVTV